MRLTHFNIKLEFLPIGLLLFFLVSDLLAKENTVDFERQIVSDTTDLLNRADLNFRFGKYEDAIKDYQELLKNQHVDSVYVYKKLAFSYAKTNHPFLACIYIEKRVLSSLDVSFVDHAYFDVISKTKPYVVLKKKYSKKINIWALFCLYVGFIGVFVFTVIILKRGRDKVANLLIGSFLLLHSFFILRISILLTNYEYYLPHTLYLSASFSFLYGPLIYFYFKRIVNQYQFQKRDVLHAIPTILFIGFMIPVYSLSGQDKLRIILHNERPYAVMIMITKLISLIVYVTMIIRIYLKSNKKSSSFPTSGYIWQRNIIILCSINTVSYAIYAVFIKEYIVSSFFFYLQIILMSLLVLYISYNAFIQLGILGDLKEMKLNISISKQDKYRKSNLTPGLSLELKEKLIVLLDQEKVYKQNDITLQMVADRLETTRNNASQIINEHFQLNFFELINSYRIEEAKCILKNEKEYQNIIDVAYEVGFNNKVTFNKSFKKYNRTTPSEYLKTLST